MLLPEVAAGYRTTVMEIAVCTYYLNNLPPFVTATLEGGITGKYFTVGNIQE